MGHVWLVGHRGYGHRQDVAKSAEWRQAVELVVWWPSSRRRRDE